MLETCGQKKDSAAEALVIFSGWLLSVLVLFPFFRTGDALDLPVSPRMPVAFLSFIRDSLLKNVSSSWWDIIDTIGNCFDDCVV